MEIKKLHLKNLEIIYEAFREVFLNYFVTFTDSYENTLKRWETAGVDLNISYGAFADGKLVAFILNIPLEEAMFHFAMGVIPEYRGQHLIEKIWACLPQNVRCYRLEVIDENKKAIDLYKRMGFKIERKLHAYEGAFSLPEIKNRNFHYHLKPWNSTNEHRELRLFRPATESSPEVLMRTNHLIETHELRKDGILMAYAQFVPETFSLKEAGARNDESLDILFREMKLQHEQMKIINIEEDAVLFSRYLEKRGFRKFLTQFEMKKTI